MFSLFSCKNCKDANIELAQAKDELLKLKIENKRSSGDLAQTRDELLKVNAESQRLHRELQEAQQTPPFPEDNLLNSETEADHLRQELQEITQHLSSFKYELLKLKVENKRLHQELQEAQQNSASPNMPEIEQSTSVEQLLVEFDSVIAAPVQISSQHLDEPKVIYIASWSRNHFHRPNCVWMENLPGSKLRNFYSHDEAVKAGYRPCKTCCA